MKSRQGMPEEPSVLISFVFDTSLGQRKFSKSESAYADIGIEHFVKWCPHMRTMVASDLKIKPSRSKAEQQVIFR